LSEKGAEQDALNKRNSVVPTDEHIVISDNIIVRCQIFALKIVYFDILKSCFSGKLQFKTIFHLIPGGISRNNLNDDFTFSVMLLVNAKIRHIYNTFCRMATCQAHFAVKEAIKCVRNRSITFFKSFFHPPTYSPPAVQFSKMLIMVFIKIFLQQWGILFTIRIHRTIP